MKRDQKKLLLLTQLLLISIVVGISAINPMNYCSIIKNESASLILTTNEVPTLVWEKNGTAVCNINQISDPRICSDGNGGAIFVWTDWRNPYDIYAQRIDSSGNILWEPNGTVICNASGNQAYPEICATEDGGAIIVWIDERAGASNYDIYAQRINTNGNPMWTQNGVVVTNASGIQRLESKQNRICYFDSTIIIVWEDERNGNWDIYAQKLDFNGNTYWGNGTLGDKNGTVICNNPTDISDPQICYDGSGGAIITWYEQRSVTTGDDVFAQRIDTGNGNLYWGNGTLGDKNGTAICNATGDQSAPWVFSDGNSRAIIAWQDERPGLLGDGIFAQKIDSTGKIYWDNGTPSNKNGTALRNTVGGISDPYFYSIGSLGMVCVWEDTRSGSDVYGQIIDYNGNIYFGNGTPSDKNGIIICNEPDSQSYSYCSVYGSNIIIAWGDKRPGSNSYDLYVQKIDTAGNLYWGNGSSDNKNGSLVCNYDNDQSEPVIYCDGSGNIIIGWLDHRTGTASLYAQKIPGPAQAGNLGLVLLILMQPPTNAGLIYGIIIVSVAAYVL